jgi:serine/threonine-protein kinase
MLYLMLIMPRLKAGVAFVSTLLLLLTLVASHYLLMTNYTMWIQLMTPAALLAIGYLLITTKRFLASERAKARSDEE